MGKSLSVLVDGSAFIYRAYYAVPQLIDGAGAPVGAVYGFCSMLIPLLKKYWTDLFCVVMDSGRETFRSKIYPEYKSNRSATPEDLRAQIPLLGKACESLGVSTLAKKGFEADDLIATCSTKLSQQGYEVRIISSDKDLLQLITDDVFLYDPIKSKMMRAEDVLEKYQVLPCQMTMLQALMGDASDNVPGVSGIGPRTAAKLINEFKTLDAIYQNISAIKSKKIRENLISQREILDISLRLVTLEKNVPLDENLSDFRIRCDRNKAADFLEMLGFHSLARKYLGYPLAENAARSVPLSR
ncbi:MAG: hypothetical protein LBG20_03280 [Holosporaceae bacterium]|jgi:DNA polymerase-1|nr:hypothetical protein [Holosporaceae bacterium]